MSESNQQRKIISTVMQGRVVLVTGASRGIGAATARLFAAHGASVCVNYHRSQAEAHNIVRTIQDTGGKALAVQASVDNAQQVEAMVRQAEDTLGPVDTLVMNATAIRHFTVKPFLEFNWEAFQDVVIGELAAVYFPAKALAPRMVERGWGTIIAVSSVVSRSPTGNGLTPHAAGKSGVDGFVKELATELGPYGIRVNAVAPGFIETEANAQVSAERRQELLRITPLRRHGKPEDVAGAIVLLAMDEAQFLTGNYLVAGGGLYMP